MRILIYFAVVMSFPAFAVETECETVRSAIGNDNRPTSAHLRLCIESGDKTEIADTIDYALHHRNEEVALVLLRDTDVSDHAPDLIHVAAMMDQPAAVALLLASDPKLVNATNHQGHTPLTSAVFGHSSMSAEVLLKGGSSEDIGDSMIIAAARDREIAYLIAKYDLSWTNDLQTSAQVLASACEYTDESFVQFLLDLGLSANLRDKNDLNVFFAAAQNKDVGVGREIWKLLVENGADTKAAICSIESGRIQHIREHAPDWFVDEVNQTLLRCP